MPVRLGLALVLLASLAASVRADDLAGAYALHADGGQRLGLVTLERTGGRLRLGARLMDGSSRPVLVQQSADGLAFAAAPPTGGGLASLGATTAPRRSATLVRNPTGFDLTLRSGATIVARERLVRIRAALLVHADTKNRSHVRAFHGYAVELAGVYRARGYTVDVLKASKWETITEKLRAASAPDGSPYDRVVTIGHGGWDGPSIGHGGQPGTHQVSATEAPAQYAELVAALRAGTAPGAQLFASGCRTGGSDVYERARGESTYVWSTDLARRTGRTVAGPAGKTSTEWTRQHVLAVLEGEGTARQEIAWASPAGTRRIPPRGTLAGTSVVAP